MEDSMIASSLRRSVAPCAIATAVGSASLLVAFTIDRAGLAPQGAAISRAHAATAEARAGSIASPGALEWPICHAAPSAILATVLRLAQARTEVPPAEMKAAIPAPEFADIDPPAWDGLGSISYRITTASAEAQSYFDQGLRLTYAFNHAEAQRAFRKAQKLDPACAMCFWGEALVLGPNINLPMQEDAVVPAFAAARKASALAGNASPRAQALI